MGEEMKEKRLGAGLDALLGGLNEPPPHSDAPNDTLALEKIRPNPYQPRRDFDDQDIGRLAESIKSNGMLQPLLVRKQNAHFEIIAGERRFRAAKIAGLTRVPIITRDVDDSSMLLLALVENVQRKDLNPIDKARAFRRLLEESGCSHQRAGAALGMERSTLTNFVRLLELPEEIQQEVSRGTISMGHARVLVAATPRARQLKLFARLLKEDLSVRQLERLAADSGKTSAKRASKHDDPNLAAMEQRLGDYFATRVRIEPAGKGGRIIIDYFDADSFNTILGRLGLY